MGESAQHRVIDPSVLYLGTPVYLIATRNPDGTANLAPASSHYALGKTLVLGLEEGGQSLDNLRRHPEMTVNFLSADQWIHAERLAGVTGRDPVPPAKEGTYTFEPRKFARAGLTEGPADVVDVPVVAQAPIQLEARALSLNPSSDRSFAMVEAAVLRVHAREEITVPGTQHLNPHAWHPLLYAYRHFFDLGAEVGWTRKTPFTQMPEQIRRWEETGGGWRILSAGPDSATVQLIDCTGGEVVEEVRSSDPHFVKWANVQAAAN